MSPAQCLDRLMSRLAVLESVLGHARAVEDDSVCLDGTTADGVRVLIDDMVEDISATQQKMARSETQEAAQ